MYKCEFCHAMFVARPQVKRPRACQKCQKRRQLDNQKTWRIKNKGLEGMGAYFKVWRESRGQRIRQWVERLMRCLGTGGMFHGEKLNTDAIRAVLLKFISALGIRAANKLWIV